MRRFERFEVKNEMMDIKEIRKDDTKQTGGKSSYQTKEELTTETEKVGFDRPIDFTEIKITQLDPEETKYSLDEYRNSQEVKEKLKSHLVNKMTELYGNELSYCNLVIEAYVEAFLEHYKFNGLKTYKQLQNNIELRLTYSLVDTLENISYIKSNQSSRSSKR